MIPKSLHTVTAIVNVARAIIVLNGNTSNADAISAALVILGHADSADTYGLADKARKALAKVLP